MTNMAIIYVDDNTARVTKAFMKKAYTYGTDEFKLWREYKAEFPNAKMIVKKIKKNPDKKTNRNMKYKNMVEFMDSLPNAEELRNEFEIIKKRSKIQTNPYQYVLEWFEKKFAGYDELDEFLAEKEAERKAKEEAERKEAEHKAVKTAKSAASTEEKSN